MTYEEKYDRFADRWAAGLVSEDIWKYIPESSLAAVTDACADADGYWVFLDHENGWVAYDGHEDCGVIHEYRVADLRDAVRTIRRI